jgi:hypothetical protein
VSRAPLNILLDMSSAPAMYLKAPVIVESEEDFWAALGERVHQFDVDTPTEGEAHEQIDGRLVARIDEVIRPVLGPHGYREELWFENLDFYGDGVRQLSFAWKDFPPYLMPQLQVLLAGEHELFCILCKFHTERMEKGELVGLLALFKSESVITRPLFDALRSRHV